MADDDPLDQVLISHLDVEGTASIKRFQLDVYAERGWYEVPAGSPEAKIPPDAVGADGSQLSVAAREQHAKELAAHRAKATRAPAAAKEV